MEMEHINENTIRVLINDADLEERGITMLDLLGNQRQIESFFYSILEEVDIDETFRENDMITFQVVPNKKGLELYISKEDASEENPFSRFQNYHQQLEASSHAINDEEFHWIGAEPGQAELTDNDDNASASMDQKETVFEFSDIEDVILFAQHVDLENGLSFLHAYEGRYYLTMIQFVSELPEMVLDAEIAQALEFGERAKLGFSFLEEYGQEIMSADALKTLRKHFN